MTGFVGESLRAFLDIQVAADKDAAKQLISVWIDTAFNGCLVIPCEQIQRLGLKQTSTTQAILADGRSVDLETFTCYLDWFGIVYRTQVVANDGEFPLLGTMLLAAFELFPQGQESGKSSIIVGRDGRVQRE